MTIDRNATSGWTDVITRITPMQPTDLDAALGEAYPRANAPGAMHFSETAAEAPLVLDLATEETVCFGARITKDTPNRLALAMSLAQMAEEKGATPIILSHVEICGLERFGFRVERVAGKTEAERQACEAQIRDFWNIVLVI